MYLPKPVQRYRNGRRDLLKEVLFHVDVFRGDRDDVDVALDVAHVLHLLALQQIAVHVQRVRLEKRERFKSSVLIFCHDDEATRFSISCRS